LKKNVMHKMFKFFLIPVSIVYGSIIFIRNKLYDLGIFKTYRLSCFVISVGNLTTGGTGKTPITIFLAKILSESGYSIGILSRGYGRTTNGALLVSDGMEHVEAWERAGDEPAMMANQLPGVPIVVDGDRIRGGEMLISKFNPDVIILDDAYQHRRLFRNMNLLVINEDGKRPGFQHLLPAGNLREPFSQMKRATALIISKANIHNPGKELLRRIEETGKTYFLFNLETDPRLRALQSPDVTIDDVNRDPVFLMAGIGHPQSFIASVEQSGFRILGQQFYRDHHNYSANDIDDIKKKFKASGASMILTTEKDMVRLKGLDLDLPVYALHVFASSTPAAEKYILNQVEQLNN